MDNLQDRSTRPSRQPWSPKRVLAAGILTFGLAFGVGSVGTISSMVQPHTVAAQDTTSAQAKSVADVYAQANPAVVTITTFVDASTLQQAQGQQQFPGMPNQGGDGQTPGQQLPSDNGTTNPGSNLVEYASGSGFIIDEQGHVVTNNHVVEGAVAFQVRYSDGTTETATLVGTDPFQDVAVLKIDLASGATVPATVAWGDSSAMRPGDEVVAIGTPYGEFNNTVSDGMIGAVDGDLNSGGGYSLPNLIQHDAAIYPGNSGGPLLNMQGEVIGINVAKAYGDASSQSTDEGFNFAIESNAAKAIVDEIISTGHFSRPYLGIQAQATQQGVQVMEVEAGGPAATGGLQVGDLIVGVSGDASSDPSEALDTILFNQKPGDTVTLEVIRDGQQTTVDVTLGERPTALPQ